MTASERLKTWRAVDGPGDDELGTLRWHHQPVLAVLRGIRSERQRLDVVQEYVRSWDDHSDSLQYAVTRAGTRIGTLVIHSSRIALTVSVSSYHGGEWRKRFETEAWRRKRKPSWGHYRVRRPRPKLRKFAVLVRKRLIELDDVSAVKRVMLS